MILADTGFWVALANARDRYHQEAMRALAAIDEPLITTWPVMTETCHLLLARVSEQSVRAFIESGTGGAFEIFELSREHLPRIGELMLKYAKLPMDLADASLVILAEHLGTGRILSTDRRDFGAYRWKNRKPFSNLLAL
jgi:predicted nucleic acid-binding protein